jgi:aminopeptidase
VATERDDRIGRLAELLVGRSLDVQPGWQVLVVATPLARPLVEELVRSIARRGAYPLVRLSFTELEATPLQAVWAAEAPEELVETLAPVEAHTREHADARILVFSAENIFDGSDLPDERRFALRRAAEPFQKAASRRPWVACPFPTQGLAQEARLPLHRYAEILYAACLRDWDAEGERMRRIAERFDAGETVRIVAAGTDLSMSIAGRRFLVDDAHLNMPGGEVFTSPVEDSVEGAIEFSEYAGAFHGHRCDGIRLRFEGGRVVDASARSDEAFLFSLLDTDDGARRLGELGIGCNDAIPREVQHMWWDEKIAGTIHIALGQGFAEAGGTNESAIHWDLVKDLTRGRIEVDGEVVQEHGVWSIPGS